MPVNYDQLAADYDRRYKENLFEYGDVERALVDFLGTDRRSRVLEVGCGTGHWLPVVRSNGQAVEGLDASIGMLRRARAQLPGASVVLGRAERLPYRAETFDRAFCINAFHHFSDKVSFLAEARRVLRPRGGLFIVGLDPHTGLDRWWIYDYFPEALTADKDRYPSTATIRARMQDRGFTGVRSRQALHLPARVSAREALQEGQLDQNQTSQLALLSVERYESGIEKLQRDIEEAGELGEDLQIVADLRLYATTGWVPE